MTIDCKLVKTSERFRGAIMWGVECDGEHIGYVHKTSSSGKLWMNDNEDRAYYGLRSEAVTGLVSSLLVR